jgi:hypothetical protein
MPCANALSKHYLNQSVMLPDRATKVATLAQGHAKPLGHRLQTGRTGGAGKNWHANVIRKILRQITTAAHRAITELTCNLLRSTQLYLSTPPNLWLELHTLYLLSAEQQLTSPVDRQPWPLYRQLDG